MPACSSLRMAGSAIVTTRLSSETMNSASAVTTNAHIARAGRAAAGGRGGEVVLMTSSEVIDWSLT